MARGIKLNQSLVYHIFSMIFNVIFGALTKIPLLGLVFGLVGGLVDVGFFVLWIIGLVHAVNEEDKPIPVIGGIQILK